MAIKKLHRSRQDKVVAGVLGGLAEYGDIDSTFLRLGFLALLLITGIFPFVIFYLLAIFIVPKAGGKEMSQSAPSSTDGIL